MRLVTQQTLRNKERKGGNFYETVLLNFCLYFREYLSTVPCGDCEGNSRQAIFAKVSKISTFYYYVFSIVTEIHRSRKY